MTNEPNPWLDSDAEQGVDLLRLAFAWIAFAVVVIVCAIAGCVYPGLLHLPFTN